MPSTTTPKIHQENTHIKLCALFDALPRATQMWVMATMLDLVEELPSTEAVKSSPVHNEILH